MFWEGCRSDVDAMDNLLSATEFMIVDHNP
jgi:hypothetical protein